MEQGLSDGLDGLGSFRCCSDGCIDGVTYRRADGGAYTLDIPLLLGTFLTEDPDRARVFGFFLHLGFGQVFALGYAFGFAVLGTATWWLGALFGLLHVGLALTAIIPLLPGVHPRMSSERAGLESRTVLEPPGLLVLNYGRQTPLVATMGHVLYGMVLGLLINPS